MKKRILVIDDDRDLLKTVKERLMLHNFSCLTLSSPETVIEKSLKWKPDLILMDLGLPGMSGFGLLREVKNRPRLAHIPVVILSGMSDEEVIREGMRLGAVSFLSKTCGARSLVSTLKEYTERGVTSRI